MPSVRLERDPAVESLLLAMPPQSVDHHQVDSDKNSCSSDCFVCGRSGLKNSEQQHREEKEYFKSLLMTLQLRSKMSSKDFEKLQENFTTCISCWTIIGKVWALRKKMIAAVRPYQLDMADLMEDAREKTFHAILQKKNQNNVQQAVASSSSSIPFNEITTGKALKKSHPKTTPVVVPKIKAKRITKDEEDSDDEMKDVKIKKKEESEDNEITDREHQHRRNIRKLILSHRLTLRPLTNAPRCGGRKKGGEKPDVKIRTKTVPTTSSTPRKTKIKPSVKGKLRKFDVNGERLSCSKCGKVQQTVGRRIHHELQHCKVEYNKKQLEQWEALIHKCTICGQFFNCNATLQHHIRVHKGEKPFSCPNCNEGFMYKRSMKRHYDNNRCFSKFKGRKSGLVLQNANCDDRAE